MMQNELWNTGMKKYKKYKAEKVLYGAKIKSA
jgi:hypothetical protein